MKTPYAPLDFSMGWPYKKFRKGINHNTLPEALHIRVPTWGSVGKVVENISLLKSLKYIILAFVHNPGS